MSEPSAAPAGGASSNKAKILAEIARLRSEVTELKQAVKNLEEEKNDLELLLETNTEHSDNVEKELQQAKEIAEAANASKSAFLSSVSHELRTPLTSILGFSKLIQKSLERKVFPNIETDDRKVQRAMKSASENINIIVAEGERLTNLINDVLDLAKIESGKMDWKMQEMRIEDLIERSTAATFSLFTSKNIELEKIIEPNIPPLTGDLDKLIQVVINLLSNAVKFTEEGKVSCAVKRVGDDVVISVTDTGIGIALEDQPKVFEKFKQVGDTLTDKPQGTGLGLPISKEIVDHHKGQLWLESEIGKGSTFFVALPTNASAVDEAVAGPSDALRERQEAAAGAAEARTQEKKQQRQAAIQASAMPQVTAQARVTAQNSTGDLQKDTLIEGIVEIDESYVVESGTLVAKLKPHLLAMATGVEEEINHSNKHILVVDDDANIRQLLRQELESEGYNVLEADNGKNAVAKTKAQQPDLVILDIMMPELSGFDVAAVLKNDPQTMHIPIVILSIIEDAKRSQRLGIEKYMTKPIDIEALLSEVDQLLDRASLVRGERHVLIVDDTAPTVNTLTDVLQAKGYCVVDVIDDANVIEKAHQTKPDMIIVGAVYADNSNIIETLKADTQLEGISILVYR